MKTRLYRIILVHLAWFFACIASAQDDNAELEQLNETSLSWLRSNLDSCELYTTSYLELAKELGDTLNQVQALNTLAKVQLKKQDLSGSIATLEFAMTMLPAVSDSSLIGNVYKSLGERFSYAGNIAAASENINKALDVYHEFGDSASLAGGLFSYGNIWMAQAKIERAEEKYLEAVGIYERLGNLGGMANCYTNIGISYLNLERNDKGIAYLEKAAAIFREQGNLANLSILLNNLGEAYRYEGKDQQAIATIEETLQIMDEIGMTEGIPGLYHTLSKLEYDKGNMRLAIEHAESAYEHARISERTQVIEHAASFLFKLYRDAGNDKKALKYLIVSNNFHDSIQKYENLEALLAKDFERDLALQAVQDSLEFLNQQNLQKVEYENDLSKKQLSLWIVIVGLIIMIAFGIIIYNRYKVTQKQKSIITENAKRLEEVDRLRTSFFANISHEFKTPLSVISGMADLVKRNPEKWSENGAVLIEDNARNLLALVNQILDLRKIEQDQLELNLLQSDMVDFANRTFELFRPLAIQKEVEYKLHFETGELFMDFDREKVLRILTNLIGNAIKFTDQGKIELRLSQSSDQVEIEVSDTGIGMSEDDKSQVFQRFYQADTEQARVGQGTGIGLQLARELAELHGGTIEIQSELGAGSTFTLVMPISNEAMLAKEIEYSFGTSFGAVPGSRDQPAPLRVSSRDEDRPHLLVVEDNPGLVQLLLAQLSEEYSITVAEDGQAGIDAAKQNIPDLIVSDVMMPRKDGFALLDELKNDELTSHIPIVMLTAKSDVESKLQGLRRGAEAYLAKPFNSEELKLHLKNLLKARKDLQTRYAEGAPEQISQEIELTQEDEFVAKFQSIFDEHMTNSEFGIQEYCQAMNVSRSQLHKKLKALTGDSTSNYVKRLRLSKSIELLSEGKLNLSEVAYQVGFSSPSYYTRSFVSVFGVPPSEYLSGD